MIKFKATVVFKGSQTSMSTLQWECYGDRPVSDCPQLNTWMHDKCGGAVDHTVGRVTGKPILHLFDSTADETALCWAAPSVYGNVAHFVDGGRKYKVCLACRKVAEGRGE